MIGTNPEVPETKSGCKCSKGNTGGTTKSHYLPEKKQSFTERGRKRALLQLGGNFQKSRGETKRLILMGGANPQERGLGRGILWLIKGGGKK